MIEKGNFVWRDNFKINDIRDFGLIDFFFQTIFQIDFIDNLRKVKLSLIPIIRKMGFFIRLQWNSTEKKIFLFLTLFWKSKKIKIKELEDLKEKKKCSL